MPTHTDILILRDLSDGRRVKVARAIQALRQIDVASRARVPVGMVSFIERGWLIPPTTRRAIFQVLGLDPGDE